MKINITMDQPSIEEAIRDYVAKNGITSPVQEVKFTVTRKGGTSIDAEVILGSGAVNETTPEPEAANTPEGPNNRAPVTDNPKPTAKAKPIKPTVTQESGPEEAAPDNVKMEDTTPPFEPDVQAEETNDEAVQEKPLNKSLFA